MGIEAITSKCLLLCEGKHDKAFFDGLKRTRNLPDFQCEDFGTVSGAKSSGIGELKKALDALPALVGFQSLKRILIAADNDTTPSDSVRRVHQLIEATQSFGEGRRYEIAQTPLTDTEDSADPKIIILMLPWKDMPGALECLCYEAGKRARPNEAGCVEQFAECAGVTSWTTPTKISKMKLHSLIAVTYQKNPGLSPAYLWSDMPEAVPLSDKSFDQIADFLRSVLV